VLFVPVEPIVHSMYAFAQSLLYFGKDTLVNNNARTFRNDL
jgi:hypothetical protein